MPCGQQADAHNSVLAGKGTAARASAAASRLGFAGTFHLRSLSRAKVALQANLWRAHLAIPIFTTRPASLVHVSALCKARLKSRSTGAACVQLPSGSQRSAIHVD